MFARRHPVLFFILMMTLIGGVTVVTLSVLFAAAGAGRHGLVYPEGRDGAAVGVVELNGVISDARATVAALKRFGDSDAVRAVVLRIDSPGGGAAASQEIHRQVVRTAGVKPVVASLGSVAASGGYYVAAPASGVITNPATLTGSIGVIIGFTNFGAVLDRLGLESQVIKSGPYKDMGSPTRPMTDAERALFQGFVDQVREQFVAAVVEGRGLSREAVEAVADGRVFSGQRAVELKLADRLGGLEEALEWAGRLAGVDGEVVPVYLPEARFGLGRLLDEALSGRLVQRLFTPRPTGGFLLSPRL